MFPPTVRLVRGYIIDYLSSLEGSINLEWVFNSIKGIIVSKQLTLDEVLKIIDNIEHDPLCLPYLPKIEKIRRLRKLRRLLADLANIEEK
ncbi:hypothetical protein DRO30_02005 [Candidatus Bathyarchaeota archaeon]|nr:MAG: hypothetical protein DRO30_02005 [Candidatus Bathyarchaeota archaeon]